MTAASVHQKNFYRIANVIGVLTGKIFRGVVNRRRQRGLRLLATDIRFEPADQLQPAGVAIVPGLWVA